MTEATDVSGEPRRKYWGWGYEGEGLDDGQAVALLRRVAERHGVPPLEAASVPSLDEIAPAAPRVEPPRALADRCTTEPYERVLHCLGRSLADSIRLFQRRLPPAPDFVCYPRDEADIVALLDWADEHRVAVIPFGGGSTVCGGIEADVGDAYAGAVSLDLLHLDRVLEIDHTSRAARIQGGAKGPAFEAELRPHGLSLRHFPQSFTMATVGGMIATRSGGHYATLHTHIDDFVESIRCVTPAGILETRRLPGSGAGPSPDRLLIGSEGILGVITEAWLRLQERPRHRASRAVLFDDFAAGAEAVRALAQSDLRPANCRLIDAAEAHNAGAGSGSQSLLVLGFESATAPVDDRLALALELVADHGASWDDDDGDHRDGAAGAWRDAFLFAPYFREVLTPAGVIGDTFETAVPWSGFEALHAGVVERMEAAMLEVTGRPGSISCRFTHVYPDGPAPYFTLQALGNGLDSSLDQWRELKLAANEAVVDLGGTVTHHHAVGRDHRPAGYDRQRPDLFARGLAAVKESVDPEGILNPGVLLDPSGTSTPGGVLGGRRG